MLNHGFSEGSDLEYLKSLRIVGSDLEFIPAGFDRRTSDRLFLTRGPGWEIDLMVGKPSRILVLKKTGDGKQRWAGWMKSW